MYSLQMLHVHSQYTCKLTPNCTQWQSPSLLDYMLQYKLSRHFEEHFENASKYTSGYILQPTPDHALKDASNCTGRNTPILLD